MRPLRVEFQAFGPYAGHETVDFESLASKGLFLICGRTGSGKTMILDAMTFALYGRSSGHGRDDLAAMRCTNAAFDATTFVRFEFENRGVHYLFERRLERKRKNLAPSYNLMRREEDGEWEVMLENAKDKALNDKAEEIIGLEYEQFRQVIVIPQGQFEKLLTSNSEEKEKILTSIFGEDRWQAFAENFYDEAEAKRNELRAVRDRITASLSEEHCDSLEELELAVKRKSEEDSALDEEFQRTDPDSVIKSRQGMLETAGRFGDLHRAEAKAAELEGKKPERAAWEKRLQDARRADKVKAALDAVRAADEMLKKRRADEAAAAGSAEKMKTRADAAASALRAHLEKERTIEESRALMIRYEAKRRDYEGADEEEKKLGTLKKKAKTAAEEEQSVRGACDAAAKVIAELQSQYTGLQSEHSDLLNGYLAGITGELADGLKEGEPCPVCGSREHPHRAGHAENSITRAMVDQKKDEADRKYEELQAQLSVQEKAKQELERRHLNTEKANAELLASETRLKSLRDSLVPGIESLKKLDSETERLRDEVRAYAETKEKLEAEVKKAGEAYTEARTRIAAAAAETADAGLKQEEARKNSEMILSENGFASAEDARQLMMPAPEQEELAARIAHFDADLSSAGTGLAEISEELKGKEEPDAEECRNILNAAQNAKTEYREKKAVLTNELERLRKKLSDLRRDGESIEEKIREAEHDLAFAKKLRGDSGTGIQRYVLGIMFSSVIAAANRMLEMVHGGRYRLYRSDEKAQGTNKRGLELKVFDRNSGEHEGRFVSTLSGGEKFLTSLALSIGMSTIAQKSGIRIEALFIDEGFGSLDEDSVADAMNVLGSISSSSGLVGIISHVQLLQDQIPTRLQVVEDGTGSHIVKTIG